MLPISIPVDVLTVTPAEVLQRVRNVEESMPSKRVAVVGSDHVGDSIRYGIRVDAKREHKPVRGNTRIQIDSILYVFRPGF